MTLSPGERANGPFTLFARAAFLACSWTWCIGMYLPIILLREFGWPGFVAFIVPNCIGAMSVGLLLRAPGASSALLVRRRAAVRWFSLATLAFHAFFCAWVGLWFSLGLRGLEGVLSAGAVFLLGWIASRCDSRAWSILAVLVWLLSAALLTVALSANASRLPPPAAIGDSRPLDLLYLAPVLAFGFGLCPFLDPTFHRVRREAPGRPGTAAFVLAFLALFPALILGVLLYAGAFPRSVSHAFVAFLLVQSAFTVGAHMRELRAPHGGAANAGAPPRVGPTTCLLVGVVAALLPYSALTPVPRFLGPEDVYRLFLGLYGLVFPVYVWCAMVPRRKPVPSGVWLGAIVLAAPFFWLGFIEERWVWLAPGLLVALLPPLLARPARTPGIA